MCQLRATYYSNDLTEEKYFKTLSEAIIFLNQKQILYKKNPTNISTVSRALKTQKSFQFTFGFEQSSIGDIIPVFIDIRFKIKPAEKR
jgi:ssDNA-specific exonuclease RecJ